MLHSILSGVEKAADLGLVVERAVSRGELSADSSSKVESFLASRIASHPEFFPEDGTRIIREREIISCDGIILRPDRALLRSDGSVLVVDYKFGSFSDDYIAQISKYRDQFASMGYKSVQACLWFVYRNEIIYL